jgi:hypothetical protein
MKTAEEYARIILDDIHHDMAEALIPRDVGSFDKLHDIFDANELIIKYMEPDFDAEHPQREGFTPAEIRAAWEKVTQILADGSSPMITGQTLLDVLDEEYNDHARDNEEYNVLVNKVLGLVDKALAREASPDWCLTCGNPVEHGKCLCWGLVAQALEQYLGRDYDHAAQQAADLWRRLSLADKLRVWHADYADDHFTYENGVSVPVKTYPRPERNPENDHRPGL